MSSTWRREMEEAAVRIAFPEWELREDDTIKIDMDLENGYETLGPYSRTEITVSVQRSDYVDQPAQGYSGYDSGRGDPYYSEENKAKRNWTSYSWDEAWTFWQNLMTAGDSERW